jgi:hypothetical protein
VNTLAPFDAELAFERVLGWQNKLHRWAVEDENKRFGDLFNWLLHVLGGSGGDGSGVKLADDEVDHRDEVAVGAVPAGWAFRGLDQ